MALPGMLEDELVALRDRYPVARSAVIPCLWAVQEREGYISAERFADIASVLGLVPSEVESVASFYSMFALKPRGDHFLLVCTNVSCALRGADDVVSHLEKRLGPSGSTSADGSVTWESTVECLGGCGQAPSVQLDHHFHESMTPEKLDALLERLQPSVHSASHAPKTAPVARNVPASREAVPAKTEPVEDVPSVKPKRSRKKK